MRSLLKIFNEILIRFLGFSLAFFFSLIFIPSQTKTDKKQSVLLLNVEIYKRPANEDCGRPNPLILLVKIDKIII